MSGHILDAGGHQSKRGRIAYGFVIGDSQDVNAATVRGMFGRFSFFKLREVVDGLSNTAMMAELRWPLTDGDVGHVSTPSGQAASRIPANCRANFNAVYTTATQPWRGRNWGEGQPGTVQICTILPPNSPSCFNGGAGTLGIGSAGSMHAGGVLVLMGDGSVRFVSENIDAGNQGQDARASQMSTGSPFGVWGAMGTRGRRRSDGGVLAGR